MDYSIKIGGEAGQGIQTVGDILVNILVALDKESITSLEQDLNSHGTILYDSSICKFTREDYNFLDIPFDNLALEHGKDKIMVSAQKDFRWPE